MLSTLGDAFFNLAVLWAVYSQSGSILQTALIQVFFHLPTIAISPYAGVIADRVNRKVILVASNAGVTLALLGFAIWIFAGDGIGTANALLVVVMLNSLTAFASPAGRSIIPSLVAREHLARVTGWFGASFQVAALAGASLAESSLPCSGRTWQFWSR